MNESLSISSLSESVSSVQLDSYLFTKTDIPSQRGTDETDSPSHHGITEIDTPSYHDTTETDLPSRHGTTETETIIIPTHDDTEMPETNIRILHDRETPEKDSMKSSINPSYRHRIMHLPKLPYHRTN